VQADIGLLYYRLLSTRLSAKSVLQSLVGPQLGIEFYHPVDFRNPADEGVIELVQHTLAPWTRVSFPFLPDRLGGFACHCLGG
jgi:hypothetical protein